MTNKKETIEEYLKRGGKVTQIPPEEYEETHTIKPITVPQIMPLDHGELFFTEKQTRKKSSDEEKNLKGREKLSKESRELLDQRD
jgi:hypothetical protein